MTIFVIFLVLALVCFIVAIFSVATPVSMTALGLAFLVLVSLITGIVLR